MSAVMSSPSSLIPNLGGMWPDFQSFASSAPKNLTTSKAGTDFQPDALKKEGPRFAIDVDVFKGSAYSGGRPVVAPLSNVSFAISEKVRRRLFDLLKYAIEDGDVLPNSSSVMALERFIVNYASDEVPLIATDEKGLIVATWRRGQQSMLSIKFDQNQSIHYAWTLQDKNKVTRDWGESDFDGFLKSFEHRSFFLGGKT